MCIPIISPLLDTWCIYILYSENSTQLEWNIRTFRTNRGRKYLLREINSRSVDFLKDKSPNFWWNLKRTSICMSYNKTFNHLAVRERSWILTKSPGMVHLPHLIKMVKICLFRRMRFVINLQMLRRVSLRMRFILDLSFLNMQLVHMFRNPHPM